MYLRSARQGLKQHAPSHQTACPFLHVKTTKQNKKRALIEIELLLCLLVVAIAFWKQGNLLKAWMELPRYVFVSSVFEFRSWRKEVERLCSGLSVAFCAFTPSFLGLVVCSLSGLKQTAWGFGR